MRVCFVAVAFAVCSACPFAMTHPPAPAKPQQAEVIDFDALRAKATSALEMLQQSRERRLASVASTAF